MKKLLKGTLNMTLALCRKNKKGTSVIQSTSKARILARLIQLLIQKVELRGRQNRITTTPSQRMIFMVEKSKVRKRMKRIQMKRIQILIRYNNIKTTQMKNTSKMTQVQKSILLRGLLLNNHKLTTFTRATFKLCRNTMNFWRRFVKMEGQFWDQRRTWIQKVNGGIIAYSASIERRSTISTKTAQEDVNI